MLRNRRDGRSEVLAVKISTERLFYSYFDFLSPHHLPSATKDSRSKVAYLLRGNRMGKQKQDACFGNPIPKLTPYVRQVKEVSPSLQCKKQGGKMWQCRDIEISAELCRDGASDPITAPFANHIQESAARRAPG